MDIIEKKDIKKVLIYSFLGVLVMAIIPLIPYYLVLGSAGTSSDPIKWGVFGDYFGGVVGTIFSAAATILALFSIYFSLKIAVKVQTDEHNFNIESVKRDNERFQKEIELTHKQNKPFPYLDLLKLENNTKIVLHNYGTGPMIVNKMFLLYEDKETYPHFVKLVKNRMQTKMKDTVIHYNSAPTHVLPPNGSKDLLEILPEGEPTDYFRGVQTECRDLLEKCKIYMFYEDLFENKSNLVFPLSFLKNT